MMRMHHRGVALLGGLVLAVAVAAPALAQEAEEPYLYGALRKLGRGATNIITSPLELMRTHELTVQKEGYLAGMSVGVVHGALRTVLRAAAGVIEIATFPLEIPEGFAPIMKPEYVFVEGAWTE